MHTLFLLFLMVSTVDVTQVATTLIEHPAGVNQEKNDLVAVRDYPESFNSLRDLFHQQAATLSAPVINKVLTALNCSDLNKVAHNNILTIIDYSLPSSEKRLWVFDIKEKKLLFHTYVSHGITSGRLFTDAFSNRYNSKASSLGVYRTEKAYYGREGLSLRLDGLDRSFNDNASNRSVVMHGGWYVEEQFIKKYGRAGRSWGCPALPLAMYQPIINAIKDNSFMVVYYPSDSWFVKSKFLNCQKQTETAASNVVLPKEKLITTDNNDREGILFADIKKNSRLEESDPIVVMSADQYEKTYHAKAPLERMLRRQINKLEYIALSNAEFDRIASNRDISNQTTLDSLYFVIPEIKMIRGYYETQMKIINFGKIKAIHAGPKDGRLKDFSTNYTVYFDKHASVSLKSTKQFIRWLGL